VLVKNLPDIVRYIRISRMYSKSLEAAPNLSRITGRPVPMLVSVKGFDSLSRRANFLSAHAGQFKAVEFRV
jgi:hypothetical protein